MGVSKNGGAPKWINFIMENPIKMDDLGGFPPIFGNTQISEVSRRLTNNFHDDDFAATRSSS